VARQRAGGSGRVTPKTESTTRSSGQRQRGVNKVALVLVVLILVGLVAGIFAGLFGADGVPVGTSLPPTGPPG